MDNIKNDEYFIKRIIKDITFILEHTENITLQELEDDEMLTCALCFKFTQISESASKLSLTYKNNFKDIPWHKISGLRNLIVHDYGNVKLEIIYDTVKKDLSPLLKQINFHNS